MSPNAVLHLDSTLQKPEQPVEALTDKQEKEIEALTTAICHNMSGGVLDAYLVDAPVLSSETEEGELYTQWFFLWCLNSTKYMQTNIEMLRPAVHSIDENSMKLTGDQAEDLLRMAGAVPNPGLKDYLKNEFYLSNPDNELLEFEPFLNGGETIAEHYIENIELQTDGRVKVTGATALIPGYGVISQFEVVLYPNENSVFGGYTVERFSEKLPDYPGMKNIVEVQILPEQYSRPLSASENPFDYVFELDGYMYQMPFPTSELINNGWVLEENGTLDKGGRALSYMSKDGQRISVGLWNYNTDSCSYEDSYVVWLTTKVDHWWAQVDFNLIDGSVRNGINENELKAPVTCFWYKRNPGYYATFDPLYNNKYGYLIYPENQTVVGFEIGYAPNPYSRRQRLDTLIESGWENDPVIAPPYDKTIEIQLNHIYKVDIDGDGKTENIDIRYLDGIGVVSGILCVIVDGEAVASVEGATDILVDVDVIMSIEENNTILSFEGFDAQSNDIYKEIRLKKGQSEVITSYVNGKPN